MIRRVFSSLATFREPSFSPVGLNIVLADRTEDSKDTDSTNGLGKSTLIRIIHFAFGSDLARDRSLNHPGLLGVTFGVDFDFEGTVVSVWRDTATPSKVRVSRGFVEGLPVVYEKEADSVCMSLDNWRAALCFRFIPDASGGGGENFFSPTFREVMGFLARIGKAAFVDPEQSFRNQKGDSKRLVLAYLLNLNWTAQRALSDLIHDRERVTAALKAVTEAAESSTEDSIGAMEAQRVVLERTVAGRQEEIDNFNLRDDYHDLERRLSESDRALHELINENYADRKLLRYYEESTKEVPAADASKSVAILREAGALFNEGGIAFP